MEIGGKVTYKVPKYDRKCIPRPKAEKESRCIKIIQENTTVPIRNPKKILRKIAVKISSIGNVPKKLASKRRDIKIKIIK